nr:transcriptional repressor NrdR [Anaerolineae bacterium]
MRCPYCHGLDTRVIDTSADRSPDEIRRRRVCQNCGERFTTYERPRTSLPLIVKDASGRMEGRREPFDAEKLRHGIRVACAKRPISDSAIDRLVSDIEARLRASGASEVSSRAVGEMVIDGLRDLDEIAYIRYAIVFLGLEDLVAVRDEIDRLLHDQQPPISGHISGAAN